MELFIVEIVVTVWRIGVSLRSEEIRDLIAILQVVHETKGKLLKII